MSIRAVGVEVVRPLRAAVLRAGLAPETAVWPGDDDPDAVHLAAFAEPDGLAPVVRERVGLEPVGVLTLVPASYPAAAPAAGYQLRGMAVDSAVRGRGVGAELLAAGLRVLAERRVRLVWCNARVSAVPFYARHGFTADGPEFELPPLAVVHVRMWRPVP